MVQFGSGPRRVWNLPLGKDEMAGLMEGRRDGNSLVEEWGLWTGDWGLGESKSGEGREGSKVRKVLVSHHKQFGSLTSEMCLIS